MIELQSREGLTASDIEGIQQLMQLRQPTHQTQLSDEESCNNSTRCSNKSSQAVKGRSKGSNHQGWSKVKATGKKGTEAVLDQGNSLCQQKKRKYRSIAEIYAETEPVDAGDV